MFSERRGRRSLHPNIQQIDKPEFEAQRLVLRFAFSRFWAQKGSGACGAGAFGVGL